ncbi:MAG: hypothetical protein BWY52_02497 [Chloroflexi bacterium ADurb.Bin325]|nr:MAG: hypothetical protein BWY52_02497 [Chloroflexi bacterium ADurb.Bin325]
MLPERDGVVRQPRFEDVRRRLALVGEPSGQQVVKRGPEAVDVAAVGVGRAPEQFRGDVVRGPHEFAAAVEPLHAGQAEVDQLGVAVPIQHDVARLDVAVNESLAVEGRQPVCHVQRHPQGGTLVDETLALQLLREILAGHQLHDQIGVAVREVERVHLGDAGMVELARGAGFAAKPLAGLRVVGMTAADQLDRHVAPQRLVGRAVYGAHFAFADVLVQQESANPARHHQLAAAGRAEQARQRIGMAQLHRRVAVRASLLRQALEKDARLLGILRVQGDNAPHLTQRNGIVLFNIHGEFEAI